MNAAFKKEQGRSFGKEASMAKLFATESGKPGLLRGGADFRRLRLHP